MRISDWSSDVCSSDLRDRRLGLPLPYALSHACRDDARRLCPASGRRSMKALLLLISVAPLALAAPAHAQSMQHMPGLNMPAAKAPTKIGRAPCRARGWRYL